ncbi:MAG: hypothetical protein ABWX92_17765, partial [Mycetocola sp.]
RRPGPTLHFAGLVARGAPASGTASLWTTKVDLSRHHLPATPAVIGRLAGSPTAGAGTTVAVTALDPRGFTMTVRHTVPSGAAASSTALFTAPVPLAWMALLPADRPALPNPEEWQ